MEQETCDIAVVVPVYNEEEVLTGFYERAGLVLESLGLAYRIVFVDDGSVDRTFDRLQDIYARDSRHVRIVSLARNFGHQLAITAGLRAAGGGGIGACAVVVMDCDLQDPPEVMREFVQAWREGYDVVYGVRTRREGESLFKRASAKVFYRLIRMLTKVDIPADAGDFYLMDRKVVDVLNRMEERHRFMRGLLAWTGFRRLGVPYIRQARAAGRTKYTLLRMIRFSFDALTSFSFFPLRCIALVGAVMSCVAAVGIGWIMFLKLFTTATVQGWSSLMAAVLFIGGLQLLGLGIIGEYLARIGDDIRRRPLYTVRQTLGIDPPA